MEVTLTREEADIALAWLERLAWEFGDVLPHESTPRATPVWKTDDPAEMALYEKLLAAVSD